MKRLFWLNVAAFVFFAGVAGYHYYRNRTRLVVAVDALRAPLASATEAELRTRGETLARMAHAARSEGGHLQRAMGWLALAVSFMFLWNAVSISEARQEQAAMRKDLVSWRTLAQLNSDETEDEDEDDEGRMIEVILKRFESPEEVRRFEKGRLEIVRIGRMTIGRASYEPGWKWSAHVGPLAGTNRCPQEHVGMVLSGTATVAFDDGRVIELTEGSLFHVPAVPHDSWVVGDRPYVSLHFMGADQYAKR